MKRICPGLLDFHPPRGWASNSGVALDVDKATREARSPTVCGKAYAPDSKMLNDDDGERGTTQYSG
ncbi:hypothetical protein F0U60_11290 [Archangium minus]|uniref:Uncharacterized protein n=1 Tax=Archangium minus TaxID=83450 RepID=A0ABY9WP72_9BACT|nr:hypothetical protein F0U60_11290 [Archangium minus]